MAANICVGCFGIRFQMRPIDHNVLHSGDPTENGETDFTSDCLVDVCMHRLNAAKTCWMLYVCTEGVVFENW